MPVLEGVRGFGPAGSAHYALSEVGALVYLPGSNAQQSTRNLVWVDRQGKVQPIPAPPHPYLDARLSPEGQRVAVTIGPEGFAIWVWDLLRGTLTKLTFQGANSGPAWTPDGKRVTFSSLDPAAKRTIAWTLADGSGQPETLAPVEGRPNSWSPDGKLLVYESGIGPRDLFLLPQPESPSKAAARPFLQTPHNEQTAVFSPDGRWIAYTSSESGAMQVYVRPSQPEAGGKWLISTGAAVGPRWAAGGRELFYRTGNKVMVVPIEPGPAFRAGTPRELFTYNAFPGQNGAYDVSADGKRFLMISLGEAEQAAATPEVHFVLEWFEEIRRRVRAGG